MNSTLVLAHIDEKMACAFVIVKDRAIAKPSSTPISKLIMVRLTGFIESLSKISWIVGTDGVRSHLDKEIHTHRTDQTDHKNDKECDCNIIWDKRIYINQCTRQELTEEMET